MKTKYLLLSVLTAGIATASADRERTFGDGELPEMLAQFDLNEDGKIDEEERQAAKAARRAARAERRRHHPAPYRRAAAAAAAVCRHLLRQLRAAAGEPLAPPAAGPVVGGLL